jgi:hypothetical protein
MTTTRKENTTKVRRESTRKAQGSMGKRSMEMKM